MTSRPLRLLFVALGATGLAACQDIGDTPATHVSTTAPIVVTAAPPPADVPSHDPQLRPGSRAAPPMLHPVALGPFETGNPTAESITGSITIEGSRIVGENGAEFVTERIAILRGGDEFLPGQRYADAMMIGTEHPVELRRVVAETWPTRVPGNAICRDMKTGYLAITKVAEGEHDVVRVMGLRGQDMPAPSAQDVVVCASSSYYARR
ncbi:hypothetical protein E4582_02510 [Luteimonas yindakuii]|uniref:Uncharacterized protein n=1 Tax=Luteimonas yindakuii TaxID=2565782 RepID=A0A4Z1RC51_9GAMM|nr:hypothetical protein [Luteimonas yindakuii]TKS53753.1 hypothetical protein E4582_02510 [Luteimonas yindakuii]